jgi:pimeloyl-ACP methyl ester carboxylesterase
MSTSIEPITGRYLHLPIDGKDYRLYFEEAGAGIPLLCLHTAGAHSSQYRHLMCDSAITDHYRVIAFDLPWHGKSNPPVGWELQQYRLTSAFYVAAITAFIEAMQLRQAVVMGCSMGGRVVVRLAEEHGADLRAVIGLEGSDHPSPWYDDSWLERPEFARGDFCAALVSGLVAPQSPDEFRWETLWHYYQSGPDVFKGDMHFYRTDSEYRRHAAADSQDDEHAAKCPVYLLTGEYDYSCTPELTLETAARIPGAEAIIMQELGHFPMSENPTRFRSHLLPVLQKIAAASPQS